MALHCSHWVVTFDTALPWAVVTWRQVCSYNMASAVHVQMSQEDPGKNEGRYNCHLTLTVYPQQCVMLTPKDMAELSRKDVVQLWKVQFPA